MVVQTFNLGMLISRLGSRPSRLVQLLRLTLVTRGSPFQLSGEHAAIFSNAVVGTLPMLP